MAQHDYNIANQSGADFRADLNNALLAIATVNSGSTEPSTTFAHQLWVDTSSSVLKIRNAADNAWITTGVSITASNTFTGDLTGDVTGNLTGNVTGNVTGDLTGNADSADILTTARTISLSGDVVGSVSFDGSTNVDIDTVVQINSITLGTDTTGDYVESMSGGTGVTVTGGTGEGSTPSIAIGQAVASTDDVTFNTVTATDEFIGDIDGSVRFTAKSDEALSKGDIIYVSGVSGNTPTVGKAKADDASKMPAFGIAAEDANANTNLQIVTLGNLINVDTSNESVGEILYVSTTAGEYSTTAPTGESSQIQNIGKVLRSHAVNGSIKVGGAGRSNATPNLDNGKIFIGNGSNQSTTATLDTSIVVENTNLYYTTARANTDFDSRLATKDTGDLTEGSNLYYTTARVNTDFDTRLATKDTGDLSEGSNLYYTDARVNSAFDTRLATKDTDDVSEGTTNLYYTTSRTNTDFDTRLATKSTSDLAEGTNLYYTSARFDSAFTSKDTDDLSEGTTNLYYTTTRFDSAFGNKTTADLTENTNLYYTDTRANSAIDARVTKAFVDALGIQANTVAANSVALGTDTTGNYIQTITGTANKITVSGSGSESADVTLSLPDDVQIADSLTVAGNLTVNGTLTSLDTTNLDIEDNLFQLNAGLTGSPVNDSGMLINRGTADNSIFMWDESVDKFTMGLTTADGSATGNITLNSLGTLVVNVEGNLTGAVTGTVSSLSNHDTNDLAEGSNLYYTQARFDSAFTAKSTSDLSEGTNLYYTDARFDTRLASKDTDDVSEGTSNLYYTSTRFDSAFGGKSTSDLSEGTNLYYTSARANTDFDTRLATKDTGDLSEGSNLYYTDARVQAVSINNVVEDTTPQLGGDLDLNSSDITGTGDINITGTATMDGLTVDGSADISGTITSGANNGAIKEIGSDLSLVQGVVGLRINDAASAISPTTASANNDNAVDLGVSNIRFKDIYLSGKLTNDGSGGISVDTSGNVGIGQTSPKTTLNVAANNSGQGAILTLENSDTSITTNDVIGQIDFYANDGSTNGTGAKVNIKGIAASGAGTNTALTFGTSDSTSATAIERMRINASGNVNVGGTTNFGLFTVTQSTDTNAGGIGVVDSGNAKSGRLWSNGTNIYLSSGATGTGNLVLNEGGGNVGIGTDSPSSLGTGIPTIDLKGNSSSQSDRAGGIRFTRYDGTSGMAIYNADGASYIESHSTYPLLITTNGSERMRIDSSGNLLVGVTSNSSSVAGVTAGNAGLITACRSSNYSGIFNRLSTDGDIVQFRKDSSTVGSISSNGGSASYNSNNGVIYLGHNQTNHFKFLTSQATGQPRFEPSGDNAIDVGRAALRFKDLYLSGGVHLGGTGSANKLDDYEEGTWTPTWTNGIGNGSTSGSYVKVGNIVHVTALFTMGSTTSIGNKLEATNLPFNCNSITYSGARYENYQSNSYIGMTRANANVLRGYVIKTGGSQATETIASTNAPFTWGVNDYAQLSITYTI